jgi:hypothetical protein
MAVITAATTCSTVRQTVSLFMTEFECFYWV